MAHHHLLLLGALITVGWGQPTASAQPPVDVACCPVTKTYLETPRPPTALMSFPGSGNTWVRHIIETLTGYHTTSVYCDNALKAVFKAECDPEDRYKHSIAVKTHKLENCSAWQQAVVVIRDPLHAIRGDYQRLRTRSHTGYVEPKDWNWEDWHATSMQMCARWARAFARVFGSEGQPGCADKPTAHYKVFFYEDLIDSTGNLNTHFLDELLKWFNINKADSFYDCASKFNKGSFARQLPADHPATKVLSDPETLRRFEEAGCAPAYRSYRSRFPRLLQAMRNEPSSIVHFEQ